MHAGADLRPGVLAARCVSGAAFNALDETGNRRRGWVRDEQVHVVGLAVGLDQLDIELGARCVHRVSRVVVSMASVNTVRRYLVTNTRWACSSDTLCRPRRYVLCRWSALRLCCG
jgi:hypothetical protein